jgi:hypothetical protein
MEMHLISCFNWLLLLTGFSNITLMTMLPQYVYVYTVKNVTHKCTSSYSNCMLWGREANFLTRNVYSYIQSGLFNRSRGYMCLLILCLLFIIFERPIGIVALSVNHMIRNLDRALQLYLFSSVSVEIALWSHVFLGLDGFPCWKSSFSKNLCYGRTLYSPWMSINVNVFLG